MRILNRYIFWVSICTLELNCSSSPELLPPVVMVPKTISNPLPDPSYPPSCVHGKLVDSQHICGLGVVGRSYVWNDPRMRAQVEYQAARSLAGMLRAVVTTALVVEETQDTFWTREERYLEIDDALVEQIRSSAEIEVWFDVLGEGPFKQAYRTYACACLRTQDVGIEIDEQQVARHGLAKQYAIDEVPLWVTDVELQNTSLRCVLGYQPRMFHPEDMLEPLTDSVRAQLMQTTKTWIRSQFGDQVICPKDDLNSRPCRIRLKSLVEAANEGISRGVALTSVWFDPEGLGPVQTKMSAYGWGCVYDASILRAAREHLQQLR